MKITILKCCTFLLGSLTLCSLSFSSVAQEPKQEKEKAIKKSQMPEEAIKLLQPVFEDARRVRFYQEFDGEQTSYEAKLNWRHKKLSIEFFSNGKLMDIEQLIDVREVEETTREEINTYFTNTFGQYKITRIQRQFTAEEQDEEEEEVMEEFMENGWDDLTIRYEIVAEVKNSYMFGPYEFLFDQDGKLIQKKKIKRRSVDNILY